VSPVTGVFLFLAIAETLTKTNESRSLAPRGRMKPHRFSFDHSTICP